MRNTPQSVTASDSAAGADAPLFASSSGISRREIEDPAALSSGWHLRLGWATINPMITYLKGLLAHKGEMLSGGAFLVVEVGGIGYQVFTSMGSLQQAPALHEAVTVYTSLIVREDDIKMVGFLTKEERELFEILGTASGVGFKMSLALMSALSVSELAAAIMSSDFKRLTIAKGVGPKLAQKITLELKDKMSKWRDERMSEAFYESVSGSEPLASVQAFQEAETVLISLGYSPEEIRQALIHIQKTVENTADLSSEEVLQRVLKWLATHPVS